MRIKKIGCSTKYSSYSELKMYHVVSQGWNEYGDLSFMFHEDEELRKYLNIVSNDYQQGKNALRQIMKEIQPHDIILAFEGNSVKGIAEVPDKFVYYYEEAIKYYQNCLFPLNWIDWINFCNDPNIGKQGGQGVSGIENCSSPQQLVDYIKNNWETFKEKNHYNIQPIECNDKLQRLLDNLENRKKESKINFTKLLNQINKEQMITTFTKLLINNYNLILTGAPGTGKTYLSKQIAAQMILGKVYDEKTASDEDKKKMDEQFDFVQFHPSFDYTDFVEGLRPIDDGNGNVSFRREDGIFMRFCRKALKAYYEAVDKDKVSKYVFVIDEINRGDLSKIFGELFFSIDPGYRGEKGKVRTQYSNLWKNENYGDSGFFYIPKNVYIIGTMNDIDRSVENMDFAMRRRFAFKEVNVEDRMDMIREHPTLSDFYSKIEERMVNLNNAILTIQGLSKVYQIGAAYFLKLENYLTKDNKLNDQSWIHLWNNHLQGLLFEYLRGMPSAKEDLLTLHRAYNLSDKYKMENDIVQKVISNND